MLGFAAVFLWSLSISLDLAALVTGREKVILYQFQSVFINKVLMQ